ncbi:phenylalanine--tRNA ligase subunit beta [Corynebacterium sp. TAE3-ERU12]|uniref:phenylalanine--tRNA ligase subunit beta n=1 Tax=Corynebacterium sp. TAE3-ERU12 TaxID=2849491 RepID=UPI001C45496A|nr:phenylalanine--tRNA ligase subunit beta [Corynebacterium sp. TAE3-ERU12]MBV7296123.1 phenylalanine--tRNA ligase subunit beta [Corynebacterium sp. TAE3-ERU12]
MFIPQSWVTDIVAAAQPGWSVSPDELDSGFVRVGFETEGHEPLPVIDGPLVIGHVDAIEELEGFKKPIRYCQVSVGNANETGEPQNIICGARNFAEGDTVVVALPGCVLPGGFAISARKTYGKVSEGMICSAAELGLTDSSSGIMTLSEQDLADAAERGVQTSLGADARPVLGLDDEVFEVNITPDRGYALSGRGLGREIASAFNLDFVDPADIEPIATDGDTIGVELRPETEATRFGLRRVTGVDASAPTPYWMQRRLMLAGQRCVNLPTDITNYVMLLLGQPMHAFDAAAITGDLTVRRAEKGEKLTTLDHVERTLDPEDVVICDESGIQSLAGVMGGLTSEVSETTTDVLLEAANWSPLYTFRTGRRHKLSSEASRRFERGVDPALVEPALDLACQLLATYGGGEIDSGRTLVGEVPTPKPIDMAATKPSKVAGVEYAEATVVARLEEVGCTVESTAGAVLTITPPTWRPDLTMPEDLVEEVLRLEGLEDIPVVLPVAPAGRGLSPRQQLRRRVGHALAHAGYLEILPTPFTANDVFDSWGLAQDDPRRNTVKVINPLESDRAQLGTTLLPAMLDSLRRNVARGQVDLALYGVEQVTHAQGDGRSPMLDTSARPADSEVDALIASLPKQPLHVASVACGRVELDTPWGKGRAYSVADAIDAARIVGRAAGVELEISAAEELPWHPGRCAKFTVGDTVVGFAGELHPQVCREANLPERTCAMELNLDALPVVENRPAPKLSPFPAVLQDVALVVADEVPAAAVQQTLAEGAGELLEDIRIFDVYRSAALGEGRRSLTFALRFRAPDRTLTEEEASQARRSAVELAAERHQAELRG